MAEESPFRAGRVAPEEPEKHPLVLQGPAKQVSSRQIRPRSVRMQHLGPDVLNELHSGGITTGTNSNGRWFKIGELLICTHRLTGLSGGEETWTFPQEFVGTPRVTATPITSNARTATVQLVTSTAAEVRVWTDSGGTANPNVDVMAIGVPA